MAVRQPNQDKAAFDIFAWVNSITGSQSALYLLVGVYIGALLFDGGGVASTDSGYAVNLWTEVLGIAVTVVIINRLSQRQADEERKRLLQVMLKSTEPSVAILAFAELDARNSLDYLGQANIPGVPLQYRNLAHVPIYLANLSNADHQRLDVSYAYGWEVNFSKASLVAANFRYAHLGGADFTNADLGIADMSNTYLHGAILRGASISTTNFTNAHLVYANLSETQPHNATFVGANLFGAYLHNCVYFELATFDEDTVLPDGTNWYRGADLSRFVNGKWQPSYDKAPGSPYQYWKHEGWLNETDDE